MVTQKAVYPTFYVAATAILWELKLKLIMESRPSCRNLIATG